MPDTYPKFLSEAKLFLMYSHLNDCISDILEVLYRVCVSTELRNISGIYYDVIIIFAVKKKKQRIVMNIFNKI